MRYILPASIIILLLFSSCKHEAPPADSSIGHVLEFDGDVLVKSAQTALNTKLFVGDIIETKTGKIKIQLNDGSTFSISENSKIILTEFFIEEHAGFRKSTIDMVKGNLRSVVSKHFTGAGSEVNVKTPTIIAGVRGTELAVTANDAESTVYCLDGKIEVYKPGEPDKKALVEKDMFVSAEKDKPIEEPKPIPPEVKKLFFEETNYVPVKGLVEAEFEAKKAEMRAREVEMKQKMKEKETKVKDKMKDNEKKFKQREGEQKSKMDEKREEMLRKMREKMQKK